MNEAHSRKKILLLGDSITQQSFSPLHRGFGAGISDWYHRTADVVARLLWLQLEVDQEHAAKAPPQGSNTRGM